MQENFDKDLEKRFDTVLNDMDAKKERFGKAKVAYKFTGRLQQENSIKLVNECLIALEQHKIKTLKLANDDQDNNKYYEAYFSEFVTMLERINNTDALDLDDADFKLIVPTEITYQKSLSVIEMVSSTVTGAMLGSVLTLLAYATVLAGLMLWVAFAITFPPAMIGTGPLLFYVMPLVAAGVGAAVGALIGAACGYYQKSPYEKDLDLDNSDLLCMLQKTYRVLNTVSEVKADVDPDAHVVPDKSNLVFPN